MKTAIVQFDALEDPLVILIYRKLIAEKADTPAIREVAEATAPRVAQGPLYRGTWCFWDGGTKTCGRCSECRDHYS